MCPVHVGGVVESQRWHVVYHVSMFYTVAAMSMTKEVTIHLVDTEVGGYYVTNDYTAEISPRQGEIHIYPMANLHKIIVMDGDHTKGDDDD